MPREMQVTAIPPRKIKLGYDAKIIYILHKYQPLDLQGLMDCLNKQFHVEHSAKSLQYDQLTFLTERGIVKELKKGNDKLYVLSDYLPLDYEIVKAIEEHRKEHLDDPSIEQVAVHVGKPPADEKFVEAFWKAAGQVQWEVHGNLRKRLIDPWLSNLPVINNETYVMLTNAGTHLIYAGQDLDIEVTPLFGVLRKRRPKLLDEWNAFKTEAAEFEAIRQALLTRILAYLDEFARSKPNLMSTLQIQPTFLNWVLGTAMLLSDGREMEYRSRCQFTSEVTTSGGEEALVYTVRPGGYFAECRSISSSREEFKEWCDTSIGKLLEKMKDQEFQSNISNHVRKFKALSQNLTRIRSEITALQA